MPTDLLFISVVTPSNPPEPFVLIFISNDIHVSNSLLKDDAKKSVSPRYDDDDGNWAKPIEKICSAMALIHQNPVIRSLYKDTLHRQTIK